LNSTLPPARDLPPHRHAQIRARLENEVTGRRRPVRYAPLITAGVATAAVVALVTVLAPWQQSAGVDTAASGTASTTSQVAETTVPTTSEASSPERTAPVIPGLSPQRVAEIEAGCARIATVPGKAVLHQYLTDAAGTHGLLYTENAVLDCTIDGPTMPYNSGFAHIRDVEWLPGEFSVDILASAPGGDGGKAAYAGTAGYETAAGRVSAKVAKVTFTAGGDTVEATITNGTFLARIPRPSNFVVPEGADPGEVQAYDAQGKPLERWVYSRDECFVNPDKEVVIGATGADPATCRPAVSWRG
jgi:hypothetical protein